MPPTITGYRDLARVAEGGFSTVYTAHQQALGRRVAVKVLHADGRDPVARQRFQDECRLTGRLSGHPHIITVFEAGITEDQRFYISMQYLSNGSLADRLATTGPLPVTQVLSIGADLADALAAAHAAGILHRDVKPGNILVSDQGEPVLSDFGIASLIDPTTTGLDAFTRAHTAPEVLDGGLPTVQSDLYSLGSTLCTLLTGTPPTSAGQGPPPSAAPASPTERDALARAGLSSGPVAALLRHLLATDPGHRPASAQQLAADFRELLGGERHPLIVAPATAPAEPPAPAAGHIPDEQTRLRPSRIIAPAQTSTRAPRRRIQATLAAFGAAALVAAGVAIATAVLQSPPGSAALANPPAPGGATTSPAAVPPRRPTPSASDFPGPRGIPAASRHGGPETAAPQEPLGTSPSAKAPSPAPSPEPPPAPPPAPSPSPAPSPESSPAPSTGVTASTPSVPPTRSVRQLDIRTNYAWARGSISWTGTSAVFTSGQVHDTVQLNSSSYVRIAYRVHENGAWHVRYVQPDPLATVANGGYREFRYAFSGRVKDVQWDLCSRRSGTAYCTGWS